MNKRRLLARLLSGARNNVKYVDFVVLVKSFGFEYQRTVGSHELYYHPVAKQVLNLQSRGAEAKPYQIAQFLALVEECRLTLEAENED